ncbi:MAG TPA: hypothetical protein VMA72_09470 [Streptosporangiaceae bacterium]|nr:hypothetical protein [Streptosporangiaceae bacterium]
MADLRVTPYSFPSTSDKGDDETWVSYWDRKRIEVHGDSCSCLLCGNGCAATPHSGSFLAVAREETDPGNDLLPTRPAS